MTVGVGRWVGDLTGVVGCEVFTLEDGDADAVFLEKVGASLLVAAKVSRLYGSSTCFKCFVSSASALQKGRYSAKGAGGAVAIAAAARSRNLPGPARHVPGLAYDIRVHLEPILSKPEDARYHVHPMRQQSQFVSFQKESSVPTAVLARLVAAPCCLPCLYGKCERCFLVRLTVNRSLRLHVFKQLGASTAQCDAIQRDCR